MKYAWLALLGCGMLILVSPPAAAGEGREGATTRSALKMPSPTTGWSQIAGMGELSTVVNRATRVLPAAKAIGDESLVCRLRGVVTVPVNWPGDSAMLSLSANGRTCIQVEIRRRGPAKVSVDTLTLVNGHQVSEADLGQPIPLDVSNFAQAGNYGKPFPLTLAVDADRSGIALSPVAAETGLWKTTASSQELSISPGDITRFPNGDVRVSTRITKRGTWSEAQGRFLVELRRDELGPAFRSAVKQIDLTAGSRTEIVTLRNVPPGPFLLTTSIDNAFNAPKKYSAVRIMGPEPGYLISGIGATALSLGLFFGIKAAGRRRVATLGASALTLALAAACGAAFMREDVQINSGKNLIATPSATTGEPVFPLSSPVGAEQVISRTDQWNERIRGRTFSLSEGKNSATYFEWNISFPCGGHSPCDSAAVARMDRKTGRLLQWSDSTGGSAVRIKGYRER